MSLKGKRGAVKVIGIVCFLLAAGIHVPFRAAGAGVPSMANEGQMDQSIQLTQKEEKDNPPDTQRVLPPTNDSEMVIKPETPPDPDAVVTPPVIDSEMAVDPATRQPMTPEKLDRLTPEELEKGTPDERKK